MQNCELYSHLTLYCDNCAGQNKNQTMKGYLSYLVKIKKFFPVLKKFHDFKTY